MTTHPDHPHRFEHPAWRGAALAACALTLFVLAAVVHSAVDAVVGSSVRALPEGRGAGVPVASSPQFAAVAGALAGTALTPGHQVDVLTDHRLYERLLRDLAAARRSITFYVYYCEPGRLAQALAATLAERSRAGVRVLFMADGFACRAMVESVRSILEGGGVEVALLRPVRWLELHRSQHRDHARMVVIDGRIGYTGGFGLGDEWIGETPEGFPWRDTNVRFTGPAVRELQGTFLASWAEATGDLHGGGVFIPSDSAVTGGISAGLLSSAPPVLGTSAVERTFALTANGAERTLFVTNAYFVPSPLVRSMLEDAAERGVDVRVLVPGPRTDVASTRWAGRGFYGELLERGVRIYEYDETMMHAKTIVADGVWSVVGSMNMDNRSTRLNDEVALLVSDSTVGATLDSIFSADLARAREVRLPEYRARPIWERILEWATWLVAPVL